MDCKVTKETRCVYCILISNKRTLFLSLSFAYVYSLFIKMSNTKMKRQENKTYCFSSGCFATALALSLLCYEQEENINTINGNKL